MATVLETVQGMIDATIRRVVPNLVRGNDTALGTLIERDFSGLTGRATFDPSANPVPVKISGGIDVFEGDRVGMIRTGGYWMVVGSLSVRGMGEAHARGLCVSATHNSTSYADAAGLDPIVGFRKFYSGTSFEATLSTSLWSTVNATGMRWGVRVTGISDVDGTAYDSGDIDMVHHHFNTASEHQAAAGGWRTTSIPPGTFTITPRWRRVSGTGVLTQDSGDWFYLTADEIRRQV